MECFPSVRSCSLKIAKALLENFIIVDLESIYAKPM